MRSPNRQPASRGFAQRPFRQIQVLSVVILGFAYAGRANLPQAAGLGNAPERLTPKALNSLPAASAGNAAIDQSLSSRQLNEIAAQVEPSSETPVIPPAQPRDNPVTIDQDLSIPITDTWTPRNVQTVLEAQIYLARRGISPGPIDGVMGNQTRAAIQAFQSQAGLPSVGELDDTTRAQMSLLEPNLTNFVVTADDLARLQPVPDTWLGKSQVTRLDYAAVLEMIAEKGFAYQGFIRRLNPGIDWTQMPAATAIQLPNVSPPRFAGKAAQVRIFLARRILQAFDEQARLMVHFPCSIGQRVDKRPLGELRVSVLVHDPEFTFDPEVFPESEEGRQLGRKLRIPPGPNNPVGVAWIGLDRPGYGIHGTPDPEKVGRTESHGCFRLANWNARLLLDLAWEGMPVLVEP